ncbi:uncharacterized protein LOC128260862 [Drosophila gunungcola]|uniref:uncharacterized protein LOC128260862 n=1 Tax=Drosophila gunungcola TaxID=103775 RepID=UPI0022E3C43D|nr:uncharacterized protein LOC128260862 [Drosophila gunungcola]
MAPVLRKKILKRPTPGRGTRNVYENCLASDSSTFTVRGDVRFPSENANREENIPRSSSQQKENSYYGLTMAEINEMSNIGVSVRNKPFANFLQDYSMTHGIKLNDSMGAASASWGQMTAVQKRAFQAKNYSLKLFSSVKNRSVIMNALGASVKGSKKMTKEKGAKKVPKKLRKPLKRLKAKAKKPEVQNKSTSASLPEEPFELPESSNSLEPMQQANDGQIQNSTIQDSTVQVSTIQVSTIQVSTIQDSTIQNPTAQDSTDVQSSDSTENKRGFIGFVKGFFN